jgi:glucan 1,3-beta-glucosidase
VLSRFVHESWMTPSTFTCASGTKSSELDIASGWGSVEGARAVLERHWDTWINKSDFDYLASVGINTVRLPIGYWTLGPSFCQGTAFDQVADVYKNSWSRVVRAINMAGNVGIGVLIDLHGAVGSQNGQGHSGISDGATNLFYNQDNMDKTIDVLTFLMQQLGTVTNVVGIQMLNEPLDVPELAPFCEWAELRQILESSLDVDGRAILAMRQASSQGANFPIYLHDGFNLWRFSHFIGNRTDFVVQDYHSYYVFTPADKKESASQHLADVEGVISNKLEDASINERRNLVIDEWSCALTDQSLAAASDPEEARRGFCTGQMEVYTNASAGWGFWGRNYNYFLISPLSVSLYSLQERRMHK